MKPADREHLDGLDSFKDWQWKIIAIDTAQRDDISCTSEMAFQTLKRHRPDYDQPPIRPAPAHRTDYDQPPHCPPPPLCNSKSYNIPASGANTVNLPYNNSRPSRPMSFNNQQHSLHSNMPAGRTRPPPLTENEKFLLDEHCGCRKCREFYVSCRANTCTKEAPDGWYYREHTMQDVINAMKHIASASVCGSTNSHSQGYTARPQSGHALNNQNNGIFSLNTADDVNANIFASVPLPVSSAFIEEVNANATTPPLVAAFTNVNAPLSFNLGNDSDTSEENTSGVDMAYPVLLNPY
ncbi:hypothetical protein CVT26_007553 [Gymnopilus dilepis]|uniref:Uncharacterized protein n=1 Tax=Gymnopilus dilepis TaxID=231916 RepID=A0A409WWP0_9AGAR|nr:hypothetical protein CVT26_007553 [Gymnopilus dilepis]